MVRWRSTSSRQPRDDVDDVAAVLGPKNPASSVCWCIRVRARHRGKGIARFLVLGAADYARSQGAPAVEGYPTDNRGEKVDVTIAYVGTKSLFEGAGFVQAAETRSVSGGFPRVVMRCQLT